MHMGMICVLGDRCHEVLHRLRVGHQAACVTFVVLFCSKLTEVFQTNDILSNDGGELD